MNASSRWDVPCRRGVLDCWSLGESARWESFRPLFRVLFSFVFRSLWLVGGSLRTLSNALSIAYVTHLGLEAFFSLRCRSRPTGQFFGTCLSDLPLPFFFLRHNTTAYHLLASVHYAYAASSFLRSSGRAPSRSISRDLSAKRHRRTTDTRRNVLESSVQPRSRLRIHHPWA